MLKYLELLLELLWTEEEPDIQNMKKNFLSAGEKIENRGDRDLQIFHKCGFIFSAYDKLLQGKLSLDEFLATGDITSKKSLISNNKSSIQVINSIINKNTVELGNSENALFIMDTISFLTLSETEKNIVKKWAKDNNNEIIFC